MAIGFGGGATTFPLVFGIPLYPWGTIGVVILDIIVAYAITKHRLMDISVVISRATAWVIATSVYLLGYLGVVYGYQQLMGDHVDGLFVGVSVVFGLLLANTFPRVRLWIQTSTDKAFLRARYPYTRGIQFYTESFSRCTDIDAFYQLCETVLSQDFEIRYVTVYVPTGYIEQPDFATTLVSNTGQTLDTDHPLYQAALQTPALLRMDATPEVSAAMQAFGAEAMLAGFADNRLVALVLLGGKLSEEGYGDDDLSFLSVIGVQIGVVLSRLRQSRQLTELAVAQRIQSELVPDTIDVPGTEVACCIIPAAEMGGDFYDSHVSEKGTWLVLGDVTGHGIGSAMVTFMAQSMLATLLQQQPDRLPHEVLYHLNTILYTNMQRLDNVLPVAMILLHTMDGRHFQYAGYHDNLFVVRATGETEVLTVDQSPFSLGIATFPEEAYCTATFSLSQGDTVFVTTDGIVESVHEQDASQVFGEDRLLGLLQTYVGHTAVEIKAAILEDLDGFRGKKYLDDVTFLVVKAI